MASPALAASSQALASPQTSRLEQLLRLGHVVLPAQLVAAACLAIYGRMQEVSAGEKNALLAAAAVLGLAAFWGAWSRSWLASLVNWGLVAATAGYFAWRIGNTQLIHSVRLVKVGLGLSLGAWLAIWLFRVVGRAKPLNAALLGYSLAGVLLVGEAVTPRLRPEFDILRKQRDLGGHPTLGWVNAPNMSVVLNFPDDPRGYFSPYSGERRIDMRRWRYVAFPGSTMNLKLPNERTGVVRAEMTSPERADLMDCNFNLSPFALEQGREYHLSFRMRADQPRAARVESSQNHDPWESAGLQEKLALTTEWQKFEFTFAATKTDENTRLKFDVGQGKTAIELADAEFDATLSGDGPDGAKYFIETSANALGFRGEFPPQEKPPGVYRIVTVGDSFTYGYGVKEPDIFLRVLERRLNAGPKPPGVERFEGVNFGVSGYGTAQERRCYELYARQWHPDLVILSMVHNDTVSTDEDLLFTVQGPNAWERTFYLARWAKEPFVRHFNSQFEGCVPELVSLDASCRRDGAKLVVSIFRHQRLPEWEQLVETIGKGLADTGIPLIDLGTTLLANGAPRDLLVHDRVDSHPNEIAHRIAGEELERFLRAQGILPGSETVDAGE